MFVPATISETAAALQRFPMNKNGDVKMDRHDQELLDKQMRRFSSPPKEGLIAVMLATTFLVGVALGGVLAAH
jgi:hypothetical protein